MNRARAAALGLCLAITTSSVGALAQGTIPPPPAPPETPTELKKQEARERYERGLGLFAEKNFEAARLEFARAYDLAPSYRILYNIGVCDAQLNDYVSGKRNLEQYLSEGGTQVPAEKRAEVEGVLADIRPKIGHVNVRTEVGASISVDDVPSGTTPLPGPIDVNPGRRKITATIPGRLPTTQSVLVAGSETVDVALTVQALQTRTVAARDYLPVVLWGGTALLAAGAVITGAEALKASSDLKNMDNTFPETSSTLENQRTKMRSFGIAADALTGAAIVCGGAAIYATWLKPSKSSHVEVGLHPTGVSVSGSF